MCIINFLGRNKNCPHVKTPKVIKTFISLFITMSLLYYTLNNTIFWISRLSASIYLAWSTETISSTLIMLMPSPPGIRQTIALRLYSKNFRSIRPADWITSPNPIVADSWRPSTGSWAPAIRPIYRHGRHRYHSAPSVRRTFSRTCSWCTRASRSTVSRTSSPTRSSPPSGWA